ncbi:Dam family site-specific DNA-(adenine-N6)-methyltransferase [Hahella sp. CR1]|uniref:DNA adenine methylase n=1 Tax=Hahella sp. CR1 TaxID=2992807 RepID=UPI002442C84E|nr:Dam family site-specific DNA-(adenine-N6)-methyltransferase [Hahella sp. CR1]MDG9669451.1 Dam family site-specific DNA-(adenine-N6)-methyltransferase [Hahella sp. CR1]
MPSQDLVLTPFLKWAGGKRWLVQKYGSILPKKFNRYIEPFLGGGSVYFYLKPKSAVLGDINSDLVSAYNGIKENWQSIQRLLSIHQKKHCDEYYYSVRASNPTCIIDRAARFIYLNRTCFNGIYRVNLRGEFNVPRGSKNSVIQDTDNFEELSRVLSNAIIKTSDFETLVDLAQDGDLIFADPPYTVRHNLNGFIKYNEKLFSWDDQVRLANALFRARNRGAHIVLTNANHESVRELYTERDFDIETVSRYSSISAKSSSRSQYEEIVVQA